MCSALVRPTIRAVLPRALIALCFVGCASPDRPGVGRKELSVVVCADGETVSGIDVSYYQDDIDWGAVAADGIDFAFIRVSDGTGFLDPEFDDNWSGARAAGVVRGAYQYFRADGDAAAQANLLLDTMGPLEADDLPPVIDVESDEGLAPGDVAAQVGIWIDTVEAELGVQPIIYTARYFWDDSVGTDAFADYPLWVANWEVDCPNLPSPWSDWVFWQWSDSGSIAGISGGVDTDVFNGTIEDLLAFAGAEPPECGDGRCNGGESPDTCVQDCPPCGTIPAEGGIIDDVNACFLAGGPAEYIRTEADGWAGSLKWTHTTEDANEANFGEWTLFFAQAGRYRLELYTDASFAQSRQAAYQVVHAGATETFPLDQTAADGWQTLAELEFAAGGSQSVHVGDNTGEPLANNVQLVFDGLRLTRLDPPVGQDAGAPGVDAGDGDAGADDDSGPPGFTGRDAGTDVPYGGADAGCGCRAAPSARGAFSLGLLALAVGLSCLRKRR